MSCTNIIDVADVRRQLLGYKFILDSLPGEEVDALIRDAIGARTRELEDFTGISILERTVVTDPLDIVPGVTKRDPIDFYNSTYPESQYFVLADRPIVTFTKLILKYGEQQTLLTYPTEWLRVKKEFGTVSIVPVLGTSTLTVQTISGAYWLPLITGQWLNGVTPQIVFPSYTCGIPDADRSPEWAHVRLALAKAASMDAMGTIAAAIPTSASRDGVSTSWGLIQQFLTKKEMEWGDFKDNFKAQHGRIPLTWM